MPSFITKRVLDFIKSNEESNVKAILETAFKEWNKKCELSIRNIENLKRRRDEEIEELREYLEEARQSFKEAFLNIEPSKRSKDERRAYVSEVYEVQIASTLSLIQNLEEDIAKRTNTYNATIEREQKNHDMYKSYCNMITSKEASSN